MKRDITVMGHLQEIAEKICDTRCKYQEQTDAAAKKHPGEEEQLVMKLIEEYCSDCPMYEFF